MSDTTKEQWEVEREKSWREAWIKLINMMPADALNGMFVSVSNGTGSLFTTVFPAYEFEEMAEGGEGELISAKDYRNAWDRALSKSDKKTLMDEYCEPDVYTSTIEQLDDELTRCMDLDDKFKNNDDFEEEEVDDDED